MDDDDSTSDADPTDINDVASPHHNSVGSQGTYVSMASSSAPLPSSLKSSGGATPRHRTRSVHFEDSPAVDNDVDVAGDTDDSAGTRDGVEHASRDRTITG